MRTLQILTVLLLLNTTLSAQPPGGRAEERERNIADEFDHDKDGTLNRKEREAAREFIRKNPRRTGGGPGRGRGRGPGGRGPGGPPGGGTGSRAGEPGPKVSPQDVQNCDAELYDGAVLRTLFLEFEHDDWEDELAAFYRTDIMVPARLIVDGKTYENVGVGFRGNSSFFTVQKGQKRSFNITMDHGGQKQDLYGYRTLNLLNSHSDPSFLREVVYNRIARVYTAAPNANFVRLVINGESWGVYGNAQQINKDFTAKWYDSTKGARWKISPGPGSDGSSLTYNGASERNYGGYQLKSKQTKKALPSLIRLCKVLNETPVESLHEVLDGVMSVDSALWFLALDNVLLDTDGYYSRGSDYMLYQHPKDGRFHLLTYDSNETFRTPGHGGPPGGGRGRPGGGRPPGGTPERPSDGGRPPERDSRPGSPPPRGGPGPGGEPRNLELSPFAGEDNPRFVLVNRLLANPVIRARYVAHVRTITKQWLDWKVIGPVIEDYHALIHDEVKADTRKLYSYDDFVKNLTEDIPGRRLTPGLKRFVDERGAYLRSHPDVSRPHPVINDVSLIPLNGNQVVTATISGDVQVEHVSLYHSPARHAQFQQVPMFDHGRDGDSVAGDGIYTATLPDSDRSFYYVEARGGGKQLTTAFYPPNTERGAIECVTRLTVVENSPVVINEVMASNKSSLQDPQGDFDDWLELYNRSASDVDLSGKFLSDSADDARKWAFPDGTTIKAGDYLIVWADNDKASEGLHCNFKLSKAGESIRLIDSGGTAVLDTFRFPAIADDVSIGRTAGTTELQILPPSPGTQNHQN